MPDNSLLDAILPFIESGVRDEITSELKEELYTASAVLEKNIDDKLEAAVARATTNIVKQVKELLEKTKE
jgi:hypothetical protein